MNEYETNLMNQIKAKGLDETIMNNSIAYAKVVSDSILDWANTDNYKETRTFKKFDVTDQVDRWQPTPPGYFEAIEPHWNEIRPFAVDSNNQFMPERPTKFDTTKDSPFYNEAMEVFNSVNNLDEERKEIAQFWDCNPFAINVQGHAMFATKKISPGGHWMNIVKIACEKDSSSFMKSVAAYTLTSIALADAFKSAWDEKYRSNYIRPETVINRYIDPAWRPLLQTPPFPEYPSAHSVISGAAGEALTSIFGDPYPFDDSSEEVFGLHTRHFNSFRDASGEAAISRMYGGIHYRPAIEIGVVQGRKLGDFIVSKIKMRREKQ
jgi:hypothetical protein